MNARVLRTRGPVDQIDGGIDNFRSSALPRVRAQDGYAGSRLLVNRETGEICIVTFWRDERTLTESDEALHSVRAEGTGRFGAEMPKSEHFDVAAGAHGAQRTQAGNWVRLTTLAGDPTKVDEAIRHFSSDVVSGLQPITGFRGGAFFVDRATGGSLVATVWDSKETLEASVAQVTGIRAAAAQAAAGGQLRGRVSRTGLTDLRAGVACRRRRPGWNPAPPPHVAATAGRVPSRRELSRRPGA